jgi:hypothetical protein
LSDAERNVFLNTISTRGVPPFLGFTLRKKTIVLTAPLAGWLIDRYGARRVILARAAS